MLTLGVLLIAGTYLDALWTTVTLRGAGPMTYAATRVLWGLLRLTPRALRPQVLPLGGSVCLLTTIALWVLGLWAGWWAVFAADPEAVLDGTTLLPADPWQRAYFAGFAIFTLGVGDVVAGGGAWLIATDLAAISGLFLVTLAITYILPVLSAATEKHRLAALLGDLGRSPVAMLHRFQRSGFDLMAQAGRQTIAPELHLHAQRHRAYPVLHVFRSPVERSGLAVTLAIYDQALFLLRYAVAANARPDDELIAMLRAPITELLAHAAASPDPDDELPALDLSALQDLDLPLVPVADYEAARARESERRQRLTALLRSSGWDPASAW